jgi:hypothetical protein
MNFDPSDAASVRNHTFQISAAIFADESSEGSQSDVAFVDFRRLGCMTETARVAVILARADLERADDAVRVLAGKIGTLPRSRQEAFASLELVSLPGVDTPRLKAALVEPGAFAAFLDGLRNEREDAQRGVDRLKGAPLESTNPRVPNREAVLVTLRQKYEQKDAKYRAYCARVPGGLHQ